MQAIAYSRLFFVNNYLLSMQNKCSIMAVVRTKEKFVYGMGREGSESDSDEDGRRENCGHAVGAV